MFGIPATVITEIDVWFTVGDGLFSSVQPLVRAIFVIPPLGGFVYASFVLQPQMARSYRQAPPTPSLHRESGQMSMEPRRGGEAVRGDGGCSSVSQSLSASARMMTEPLPRTRGE